MKGCGKSAPLLRERRRHGKPHAEQGQIGELRVACPRIPLARVRLPGWLLEPHGDVRPR